jgi:hypothetical protein
MNQFLNACLQNNPEYMSYSLFLNANNTKIRQNTNATVLATFTANLDTELAALVTSVVLCSQDPQVSNPLNLPIDIYSGPASRYLRTATFRSLAFTGVWLSYTSTNTRTLLNDYPADISNLFNSALLAPSCIVAIVHPVKSKSLLTYFHKCAHQCKYQVELLLSQPQISLFRIGTKTDWTTTLHLSGTSLKSISPDSALSILDYQNILIAKPGVPDEAVKQYLIKLDQHIPEWILSGDLTLLLLNHTEREARTVSRSIRRTFTATAKALSKGTEVTGTLRVLYPEASELTREVTDEKTDDDEELYTPTPEDLELLHTLADVPRLSTALCFLRFSRLVQSSEIATFMTELQRTYLPGRPLPIVNEAYFDREVTDHTEWYEYLYFLRITLGRISPYDTTPQYWKPPQELRQSAMIFIHNVCALIN